ncbi:MAG: hypothetical protein NTW16_13005 [Bacteroidetes bacterium]|nr:hypothetical protein [Bacteroidota bacterium]
MKTYSGNLKIAVTFAAVLLSAIFITRPAFSQETSKKESSKKVVIKIVSDDNGTTTMIDTTMEIPDSMMMESVREEIDKVIAIGKDGKHACVKFHKMPRGFAYDFDVPGTLEPPLQFDELEGFDCEKWAEDCEMEDFMSERMPPPGRGGAMRAGGRGQTLNDILGEIPMDRVVSYSIKDRKDGKRIIIDLDDAPMFERSNKVIIIREPGRNNRRMHHPERQVKVVVNSDDSVPPPPPPPPPPDKK